MKIITESITTYRKKMLEADDSQKDAERELNQLELKVVQYLSSMTTDQFTKVSKNKFSKETITDLDFPLKKYIAIEEYMDNFVDWAILQINSEDATVNTLIKKETSTETIVSKLFEMFTVSNELEDVKKDLINLPEVQQDIESASSDADLEELVNEEDI